MQFRYWWLIIILVIIISVVFVIRTILHAKSKTVIYSSSVDRVKRLIKSQKGKSDSKLRYRIIKYSYYFFSGIILLTLIILAARPQKINSYTTELEGIDIVILLDASGSMDEMDILPSRLEASKTVILDFVEEKSTNRIGLVAFMGSTAPLVPLTFDHQVFGDALDQVTYSLFAYREGETGTAIGDAIISATSKFTEVDDRSKVIILITDGESRGGIDSITAANYAEEQGITIYPLFMSSQSYFSSEKEMQQIADVFGVELFKPRMQNDIKDIFEEIDQIEKSKLEIESNVSMIDIPQGFLYVLGTVLILFLLTKIIKDNAIY